MDKRNNIDYAKNKRLQQIYFKAKTGIIIADS